MKEFCLSVISSLAVAILLVFGARAEWKAGNKGLAIITVIVLVLTLWAAYDNYKKLPKQNI